jgi:hypothetical protein
MEVTARPAGPPLSRRVRVGARLRIAPVKLGYSSGSVPFSGHTPSKLAANCRLKYNLCLWGALSHDGAPSATALTGRKA